MADLDEDFEDTMFARMEGKPDKWRPDGWPATAVPAFLGRSKHHVPVTDWIARLRAGVHEAAKVLELSRREQKERIPALRSARAYWKLRYVAHGIYQALEHDSKYMVEEWAVNETWLVLLEEIHMMAEPLRDRTPYR